MILKTAQATRLLIWKIHHTKRPIIKSVCNELQFVSWVRFDLLATWNPKLSLGEPSRYNPIQHGVAMFLLLTHPTNPN